MVEEDAGQPFALSAKEFVLEATYETVTLPDEIAARLERKYSLGRLGLLTHSTLGFIDSGFEANVALPINLRPEMKIERLCFFQLSSQAEKPHGPRYRGQHGPTAPRNSMNSHLKDVSLHDGRTLVTGGLGCLV